MGNTTVPKDQLITPAELTEDLKGKSVIYKKRGGASRNGWKGKIVSIDLKRGRFTIEYQNGVIQDYRHDALTGYNGYNYDAYVFITTQPSESTEVTEGGEVDNASLPRITSSSCIIIDNYTGKIVGVERDQEAAEAYAEEEALTDPTFRSFTIFAPVSKVAVKQPEVLKNSLVVDEE